MITNELKDKLCKLLGNGIKARNYEWRITDKYVYIGTTNDSDCILTTELINELMQVAPWKCTVIGKQCIALAIADPPETLLTNKEIQSLLMYPKS